MTDSLTRRTVLRYAGQATVAGLALGALGMPSRARAQSRPTSGPAHGSASERIRLGFIGTGGMGMGLLSDFIQFKDVDVVAIADVYDRHRGEAVRIAVNAGHQPADYRDFRKLLDHRDIDAVVIATPDHWHALTTVQACQADKDVYVEKPLSHSIAEGRAMINAARRARRVTQMGIQMHATENYRRVVEIVQSGMLGSIGKVRVWIAGNLSPDGLGKPENTVPPADCDYDLWLGPAPLRPFNPLRWTFNWRWFWDYGGGPLADMGCHIIDLVYWALRLDAPRTVCASGGRYVIPDLCETPDTMEVAWEYDPPPGQSGPLQLVWSLTQANSRGLEGRTLGIAFYGTNATLIADYETHELIADGERLDATSRPAQSIPPSPGHRREFLDSIKSRHPCSCNIEYGHKLTTVPLMGNIAVRTNRKLHWDASTESFIDAPEANRLLMRSYRFPWVLPM